MFIFSTPMVSPVFTARSRLNVRKLWKCTFCSLASLVVTLFIFQLLFLDGSVEQYKEVRWGSLKKISSALRQKLLKRFSNTSVSACPLLSIHSKPSLTQPATCRLPIVKEEACSFAASTFTTDRTQHVCNHSQVDVCTLEETPGGIPRVECHATFCGSSDIFSVGFIDPRDGSLSWKHFSFLQDVENVINHYIENTPMEEYFPFTFLRCDEFWNPKSTTRLVLLPPRSEDRDHRYRKNIARPININLILIDSVSRPHFYRSLPETIEAFRNINNNSSIPAKVLDFEYFHAVKHRTFETIHALFSGELLQIEQNMNPIPVGVQAMFEKFKNIGYQTLWQEDMCWTHEWGLVRDLKILNKTLSLEERWQRLKIALKNNSIDLTGITHSSCEVLKSFDVPDFFHGPPTICYGGKHYHTHFLDFLKGLLREGLNSPKKPLLSFTLIDVGHEGSGLRIQTLDSALADLVTTMVATQNTLSILISDHGNTYGFYPRTMEGRFEVFQPHMFMIIPTTVEKLFGKDRMYALKENQRRLVSVVDLHYTIMSLASLEERSTLMNIGLFQPVPRNRTCQDLHLLLSSLCICQGWVTKVHTNSFHVIIAEFALGHLNKMIQSQFLQNYNAQKPVCGFGSCERLRGERLENIVERRDNSLLSVSLDIYVQNQELFRVEVQVGESFGPLLDMEFIEFTRFSEYGIYKTCADTGVDLQLCICQPSLQRDILDEKTHTILHMDVSSSTKENGRHSNSNKLIFNKEELLTPKWQFYGEIFSSTTRADNMHENCLFILRREHKSGVIFEVANSCSFVHYRIELDLSLDNMQVSERTPLHREVAPGTIHFLMAVTQLDPSFDWSWRYTVNFSWKVLSTGDH